MRSFLRCSLGVLALTLVAESLRSGDVSPRPTAADLKLGYWPQWRGPGRDGRSAETGLLKSWDDKAPKLAWSVPGMGSGYASVSIADGRIFTMGNYPDGQAVVALNADGGTQLWKTPLTEKPPKHGYDGSRCTPAIDEDRVYVVSSDGQIACLKINNGEIVWRKHFAKEWGGKMMSHWGFSESPLVDGPWVLCTPGGEAAVIVALDKLTGAEVWRSPAGDFGDEVSKRKKDGAGYSSIVVSHGGGVKQYVQLVGRGVIGVRASDGKFLWGYSGVANNTANVPTPIVKGDFVFCSTGYNTGSALLKLSAEGDGVKADEEYFLNGKTLQNHHGGMILVGDHVYLGHAHKNGNPTCVELQTGKIAWGGDPPPAPAKARPPSPSPTAI